MAVDPANEHDMPGTIQSRRRKPAGQPVFTARSPAFTAQV
jgi:hypothetical protein